ncbi:zinc ribbon domain-containing protein [Halalkalicoccus tibetensis]|uniref:Zinc ribbon domain-containing protein n=1 Tax=Halalkalicoccus tibetensis TaxID=175632 RepID=A0ABD5V5I2_9EURY
MSGSTAPNFCSRCGTRLGAGDAYCSQCGTAIGESGEFRGRTARRDGRGEFRQQLDAMVAEGWEIEGEYDDRVVLVDRGIGSIGLHVLLLLFTGGVGNLLYGWYSYSMNAERVELRADGTRRRLSGPSDAEADIDRDVLDWGFSVLLATLLLFLGLMVLATSGSVAAGTIGLICLLGAVAVLPPARRRLAARRSVGTFGRVRGTDERVIERPETPCSACASPIEQGVERRYGERTYLAGIPLWTHEHGRNAYCRRCAAGDSSDEGRENYSGETDTTVRNDPV